MKVVPSAAAASLEAPVEVPVGSGWVRRRLEHWRLKPRWCPGRVRLSSSTKPELATNKQFVLT